MSNYIFDFIVLLRFKNYTKTLSRKVENFETVDFVLVHVKADGGTYHVPALQACGAGIYIEAAVAGIVLYLQYM